MKRHRRNLGLWVVLLMGLSPLACFRGWSVSKIKCNSAQSCPGGYVCILDDGGLQGRCVESLTGGSGAGIGGAGGGAFGAGDGGFAGASGTRASSGGMGAHDLDGGVSPDGRTGGTNSGGLTALGGGAGTSPRGGSVGNPNPDAAIPTGGMGGQVSSPPITTVPNGGGSGGGASGGVTTTPVDAPVLQPDVPGLKSLGATCENGPECASGFCTDKVCCDGECKGQCESCSAAGKCTLAPKGPAPASRTSCNGTGSCASQCDGIGGSACVFPDKTICTPAVCKNGAATSAVYCSNGTCGAPPSPTACPSGECEIDGTKCTGSCKADSCGSTQFCSGGVCTPKNGLGVGCGDNGECATGFCVDGVCCDSECKDQCTACNSFGVCSRITGQPKNGRTPCTTSNSKCAGKCDLSSNTCAYPSVTCEEAKCSDTDAKKFTPASVCNLGVCSTQLPKDCPAGNYCASGGNCTPQMGNGDPCANNAQCTSGFCTSQNICCPAGFIFCLGACQNGQSDPNNCGACGVTCASNQTCSGGSCKCNGLQCGATCNSTGFEGGILDGWSADGSTYGNAASNLRVITGSTHSGSQMLNATLGYSSATLYATADFLVSLCSSGTATVSSFSIWVSAMKTSTDFTLSSTFTFKDSSNTVVKTVTPTTTISANGTWQNLTGSVSAQASKVQVRFTSPQYPTGGLIYIDDAQFN